MTGFERGLCAVYNAQYVVCTGSQEKSLQSESGLRVGSQVGLLEPRELNLTGFSCSAMTLERKHPPNASRNFGVRPEGKC